MKHLKTFVTIIICIFLTNIAVADSKIHGHMKPLDSERLKHPMRLDCGATVYEWRGSTPDKARVNKLCTLAVNNFYSFIKEQGDYNIRNGRFNYAVSIIPIGKEYRSLNDRKYRFDVRVVNYPVTGYTVLEEKTLFNMASTNRSDFNVSFVHELFHALSHHHEVFYQHPDPSYNKRLRIET